MGAGLTPDERKLLLSITRCEVLVGYLEGRVSRPACAAIIGAQSVEGAAKPVPYGDRQVPEPWTGRLGEARLLFLSSNPSISLVEEYPQGSVSDESIADFFHNRFDGQRAEPWVRDGNKFRMVDGSYSRGAPFWSNVKKRAAEAYGREVEPGIDYALTEVVHCKSKAETGVVDAVDTCVDRYLSGILAVSGARVVIVLGAQAGAIVKRKVILQRMQEWPEVFTQGDRPERLFLFQPHPSAFKEKKLVNTLPGELLEFVHGALR